MIIRKIEEKHHEPVDTLVLDVPTRTYMIFTNRMNGPLADYYFFIRKPIDEQLEEDLNANQLEGLD